MEGVGGQVARAARLTLGLTAIGAPLAAPLGAQTVRGVVVDAGERPVAGVVVALVDGTDGTDVVARALTNERGEYRLAPGRAGTYRVRTLRIGFRPTVSAPFALAVGQDATRGVTLTGLALALDTVRVADRASCRLASDSAAATFAVWEQARGALTATQLTAMSATVVGYDRTLDGDFRRVRSQTARVTTSNVSQPWRAVPVDSLRRVGYVVDERERVTGEPFTTYFAPGLDMLASSAFIEDHCFRLVAGRDARLVGVAFEPTRERRAAAEIAGTLWVDRRTSELRALEYRYANVSRERAAHAGGEMAFARLRDGGWVISRWNIRMPVLAEVMVPRGRPYTRVEEVRVTGGELSLVTRGRDTLWTGPALVLAGTVVDSASGVPARGARVALTGTSLGAVADSSGRFVIAGVLPGAYTAEVRSAALDSAGLSHHLAIAFTGGDTRVTIRVPSPLDVATSLCAGRPGAGVGDAIVSGVVQRRGDSVPEPRARVVAEWETLTLRPGSAQMAARERRGAEVRADASGAFRMCGLPRATAIALHASAPGASSMPAEVRVDGEARVARVTLTLDPTAATAATASFAGFVRADSTRAPIADAEVTIPALGVVARTDATGAFRIAPVASGTHRVVVRRVGYGPADAELSFEAGRATVRRFDLSPVRALDAMTVTAARRPRGGGGVGFEGMADRQRLGLGRFIDAGEIRRNEHRRLDDMLRALNVDVRPAMKCVRGRCEVDHTRRVAYGNARGTCLMQVVLDGAVVYRGEQQIDWAAAFDLDSVHLAQLAGVEVYRRASEMPGEYAGTGAACGLLLLWTRR